MCWPTLTTADTVLTFSCAAQLVAAQCCGPPPELQLIYSSAARGQRFTAFSFVLGSYLTSFRAVSNLYAVILICFYNNTPKDYF